MCACLFYYYLISAFKISIPNVMKDIFTGKTTWLNYVYFVVCLASVSIISKLLANENTGLLTVTKAIEWTVLTSMTDPFVFIENHFMYFGLAYLLTLFFWKDIAKIVMQQGVGYLLIVGLWILFSIRPEARVSIMYWMFPLMALLMYIDTKDIRPYVVPVATVFMLIQSRFWFHINVPNMDKYLSWDNYWHYTEFPAQRYFMSQGHWQSHDMYYVLTALTLVVGIALYIGTQRKWFTKEKM